MATSLLRWLRKWIWLPVSIVVAVQIGLLALNASYFHQISLITIPATLLALPAAFGIVTGSIAVALLGWIAPLSWIIGPILGAVIGAFEWIVSFFSSFPGALLILPSMAPWLMGLYYGALLLGPHLQRTEDRSERVSVRRRFHMALRLAFAFVVIIWLPVLGSYDSRGFLDLYVVDVGQGDSLVLRFPDGKIGVIDGGAVNSLQGRRTVAPFLRWLGTDRIDFMIATHGDADHVGGLVYLVNNFEVGLFIHGPDRSDSDVFQELHRLLEEKGINVREVRAGDTLEGFGAIEVTFLNPAPGDDGNDASVVLLIDYGEVEILLTGDIEAGAERSILDRKLAEDIDVLKIAHHGSRTSTTARFLDAFDPEIALISAGRNNQYGHPAPEVLERLSERNIAVARTDRLGTLHVRTDGRRLALYHHGD
ncbi:ComEC/Rec2 family competence protein [Candidatus Sumerlaeota bacterium]|nr:ComEC/Rec2 family competence protein [Candidatus Sumerlaeota bacterium]